MSKNSQIKKMDERLQELAKRGYLRIDGQNEKGENVYHLTEKGIRFGNKRLMSMKLK